MNISLNGVWEAGEHKVYDRVVSVPGLASDPKQMSQATLWYRRTVVLPEGTWTSATLLLKGARFCPEVYVDGVKVSEAAGGMTVTTHPLDRSTVLPGRSIVLEIALSSLSEVSQDDASCIPSADRWRSNISSYLWDDVVLKLHGNTRIKRLLPYTDMVKDELVVYWQLEQLTSNIKRADKLHIQVIDENEAVVAETTTTLIDLGNEGRTTVPLLGACRPWSPEQPALYKLRAVLFSGDELQDEEEMSWGLKDFRVRGKGFLLNGEPVTFRAGTVVWHRWTRDPEAAQIAFDAAWFEANIVKRLKSHGANGLRFHLGSPPDSLLDLCDKHGLLVQIEWLFFHGMTASKESLLEQWRHWLDMCMRHPSVCIVHPWNETEGAALETAFSAIEELSKEYPPLVVSHRDILHIHKYWWSLFENVGLYYDSADQFSQPIIADEFGGNYLDGEGMPGGYPALGESFLRFLGRDHTRGQRLQLHTEANTQVAEYWRRLGAAGYSPFCALGPPEDGNHHFLGRLTDGKPKPVWAGLTASYSPLSCSLEVWDRNFTPGERLTVPVYFFNETNEETELSAVVETVGDKDTTSLIKQIIVTCVVPAHSRRRVEVDFTMPSVEGEWRLQAKLLNVVRSVEHPIVSSWRCRTMVVRVPEALRSIQIAVPEEETELRKFLEGYSLNVCLPDHPDTGLIACAADTWRSIEGKSIWKAVMQEAVDRSISVAMLQAGPLKLGQGYLEDNNLGPLQGAPRVSEPDVVETELIHGVKLRFTELAEPESHIHPSDQDATLWGRMPKQATWLWNGLRGGIIVPAYDMEPIGLSPSAFLSLWESRGADPVLIVEDDYYAYELAGFYAFSSQENKKVADQLRSKVKFLVEDAPALKFSINPNAKPRVLHLSRMYQESSAGRAEQVLPLALCGKNLTRMPIVSIGFGAGKGRLLVSQTIIRGRLVQGFGETGLYGLRPDPAAAQFVLHMLEAALLS